MGLIAKMICVDDDIFIQRVFESIMEEHFHVALAGSAEKALDLMELQGPFDVVISGYDMPDMNGVEFLCLVAARWPESIRILMSGGGADVAKVKRAISAGHISRFLVQPFCLLTLRDQLREECIGRGNL